MNPWAIVVALILAVSLWFGGYFSGKSAGINIQKVADQAQLDDINQKLADQKAEANKKYREQQSTIIALQHEREIFKTKLEKEHVKNQDTTNRLRDAYAAYGLRFRAAEDSGCGAGAGCAEGTGTGGSGDAGAKVVQLPEAIARNLRQLAFDADQLNDDYRLCYGYANKITSP